MLPADDTQTMASHPLKAEPAPARWFLGFDCATKTFAFSLSWVDLAAFWAAHARLRDQARAALEVLRRAEKLAAADPAAAQRLVDSVARALAAADAESRSFLRLADGETVDLFPGCANKEIGTVPRLKAVAQYVARRIRPAVARHVPPGEEYQVLIEFQMGPNAPARAVAAALVALYADENVIIVGPSLKNKIATCPEGRYIHFAERYAKAYDANKAHAKYNFERVEEVFGTEIPKMRPPSLRGHIADSFMQVLGFLVHGSKENAAELF